MNQINNALLAVFNDPNYNYLHKDVRTKVEEAVRRVEFISPIVGRLLFKDRLTSMASSQGTWLKHQESRWLIRESDIYANQAFTGRVFNDPVIPEGTGKTYTTN